MKTLEDIQQYIESLGSNHIGVFGGVYKGGKEIQQHPVEFSKAIKFLLDTEHEFKSFLEIGAASGAAALALYNFFKFDDVFIIDDNQHDTAKIRRTVLQNIEVEKNLREFVGNSHDPKIVNKVQKTLVLFNLIHIDGDHSYQGVKQDTIDYLPFLKRGGYVMYHDVRLDSVKQWTDELIQQKQLDLVFDERSKHGIRIFKNT